MNQDTNQQAPKAETPPKREFVNPYDTDRIPEPEQHRTSLTLHRKAWQRLNIVHGRKGTLQTTICIMVDKLLGEMDRVGLNDYDPDRFEELVMDMQVHLGKPAKVRKGANA